MSPIAAVLAAVFALLHTGCSSPDAIPNNQTLARKTRHRNHRESESDSSEESHEIEGDMSAKRTRTRTLLRNGYGETTETEDSSSTDDEIEVTKRRQQKRRQVHGDDHRSTSAHRRRSENILDMGAEHSSRKNYDSGTSNHISAEKSSDLASPLRPAASETGARSPPVAPPVPSPQRSNGSTQVNRSPVNNNNGNDDLLAEIRGFKLSSLKKPVV
jgi:hypothetical protein